MITVEGALISSYSVACIIIALGLQLCFYVQAKRILQNEREFECECQSVCECSPITPEECGVHNCCSHLRKLYWHTCEETRLGIPPAVGDTMSRLSDLGTEVRFWYWIAFGLTFMGAIYALTIEPAYPRLALTLLLWGVMFACLSFLMHEAGRHVAIQHMNKYIDARLNRNPIEQCRKALIKQFRRRRGR